MDDVLKRDDNRVTVLAGVTDDADQDIKMLPIDPSTGRLLVSMTGVLTGTIVDNELVGTGDGSTTQFPLDNTPSPTTSLYIKVGNGELFLTDDWTLSGATITFLIAPPNGAKIRASYRY